MNLSRRSTAQEIMDDLDISGEVVHKTLKELDLINRWLGGNTISVDEVTRTLRSHENVTLADLGCGSGDLLRILANKARKLNQPIRLHGVDANPHIIRYARKHVAGIEGITVECINILDPEFGNRSFDLIHCCLFLHHFNDEQLIELFARLRKMRRLKVIINDLHRHPISYYSIKILTLLFSRSAMVKYDAPLSVARGFKRKELVKMLKKAGIEKYDLSWRWAFRWKLVF